MTIKIQTDLKKPTLYTLIVILYLLTPICILATMGTMVNKKYEVDEGYWPIDGDSNLTEAQKKVQLDALDRQGKQMEQKATAFASIAFATSITATTLLMKRRKIIGVQKSSTQQVHLQ